MLNLDRIPKGCPVGWAYSPSTVKDYPKCDVEDCQEIPKFEIFFVDGSGKVAFSDRIPGITNYWWFVCKTHRDWLKKNWKG